MGDGTLQGLATLAALLAFVGVAWWAWSGRRKDKFDAAARLPLEDERDMTEDK